MNSFGLHKNNFLFWNKYYSVLRDNMFQYRACYMPMVCHCLELTVELVCSRFVIIRVCYVTLYHIHISHLLGFVIINILEFSCCSTPYNIAESFWCEIERRIKSYVHFSLWCTLQKNVTFILVKKRLNNPHSYVIYFVI